MECHTIVFKSEGHRSGKPGLQFRGSGFPQTKSNSDFAEYQNDYESLRGNKAWGRDCDNTGYLGFQRQRKQHLARRERCRAVLD